MRHFHVAMLAAACVATSAGPVLAQGAPGSYAMAALNAPTTPASGQSYRIGPQDIIDVDVFQIPDLSKSVEVDGSGRVRLPLLGDVQAAGRTPSELAAFLEGELSKTYVKNPKVSVTMKQSSSRRVTVDGAVVQPGVYPLTGPTSLIQALALARGPDPREANIRQVALMRNVDGRRVSTIHNLSAIRSGKAVDPEVRPDDIIVVDSSKGKSLLRDIGSMMPILGWLRPF